jgi:hypothetical protein
MSHRHCGGCTLCCRLVPVETLNKPAGARCQHQTRRGCSVYRDLNVICPECRLWNCRWLVDPDAIGLRRPDHARYVIDIMPDFIGVRDDESGRVHNVPVTVVWCDPDYPDAWRDPALRRYAERMAKERGEAMIIRFGSQRGIALIPPSMSVDGKWQEKESSRPPSDSDWTNPLDAMRRYGGLKRRRDGTVALDRAKLHETADVALALLGEGRRFARVEASVPNAEGNE